MAQTTDERGTGAILCGLGVCLPEREVGNDELGARLGVSDDWIAQRTGIRRRRVAAPGVSTGDLAAAAGRRALEAAGTTRVQAVVLATTTPDHLIPGTAPWVAARLGLDGVAAFDVNAGCSGFLYGLVVAQGLLSVGVAERVLLVSADIITRVADPDDPRTTPLFGDGAGAVVLRRGAPEESGALGPFDLGSDGANSEVVHIPGGGARHRAAPGDRAPFLTMAGRELFRHAVHRMQASSRRAVERAGWALTEIDAVAPHQANQRISAGVARGLGIPEQRVLSNIAEVGNTSAASIPLVLHHAVHTGALKPGMRVLLTAFGGGLAWASTTLVWPDMTVPGPAPEPAG
ncbi:beta-ketoacyl-ACP synthase 3 [Micromonospora tarensis]|uniref:Beta-ketoacyl-ACP synthase 3 n=1 Tax=Micromonospora tarensis TaxID=2806100 RepID=A0ABS1YAB8_9ACTN|nr:beta-ketoacyl-ACP synthase 3 [Micromonospora tarensis]MBM0274315.1 beta-ketoacyl-ACP synthase 3 [Micromonospora tarensis]